MDLAELRRLRLRRINLGDSLVDDTISQQQSALPEPPACPEPGVAANPVTFYDGQLRVTSLITVNSGNLTVAISAKDVLQILQAAQSPPSAVAPTAGPGVGCNDRTVRSSQQPSASAATLTSMSPAFNQPESPNIILIDTPPSNPGGMLTPEENINLSPPKFMVRTSTPFHDSKEDLFFRPDSPSGSHVSRSRALSPFSDQDHPDDPLLFEPRKRVRSSSARSSSTTTEMSALGAWSQWNSRLSTASTSQSHKSPQAKRPVPDRHRWASTATVSGIRSISPALAPSRRSRSPSPAFSFLSSGDKDAGGSSSNTCKKKTEAKVPKKRGRPRKVEKEDNFRLVCAICKDVAKGKCVNTKCGHYFHEACLQKWLATPGQKARLTKICPYCGVDFYLEDVNPIFF